MRRHTVGDHLLPELLFNILILLEPKDLIRCMCVSKAWHASIRNPRFIKLHHQRQRSINTNPSPRIILLNPFDDSDHATNVLSLTLHDDNTFGTAKEVAAQPLEQPNSIVGCSNGLVCIHSEDKTEFALWNPSIRKSKKIPFAGSEQQPPSPSQMNERKAVHYGFGYDSANDDYKLVKIAQYSKHPMWVGYSEKSVMRTEVHVYSLNSNSWKMIESMPCNGFRLESDYAVFLNGGLSWKMAGDNQCRILTFDLGSVKYREFPIPVDGNDNCLGVLGGYLCVYDENWDHGHLRHAVWIMEENEVTESWTLLFSVDELVVPLDFRYVRPLLFSKNGEMVLLEIDSHQLVWFDLEKESAEEVEICGLPDILFEATICEGMGSLRLLLDGDPLVGRQQPTEDDDQN